MVLRVVNESNLLRTINIGKSSLNLDLWISINFVYKNMMGYKQFIFFKFFMY
jgi:hypothetical protein